MARFGRRVNMAGRARLGFGISGKFWVRAGQGRLGLPDLWGGAYIYIDPTPSKNVSASNIDVVPRNMGTIPAHGMHGGAAPAGAMG